MVLRIPIWEKFPVDAIIFQKRGDSVSVMKDRARFTVKDGVRYYELKKYGSKFRPSSFDDFITQNNGRPLVMLYEYQRDMLVPVSAVNMEKIYKTDKEGLIEYDEYKYCCNKGHYFNDPDTMEIGYIHKKKVDICPQCEEMNDYITKLDPPKKVPVIEKYINLHSIEEDMAFWGQMRRWKAEERHKDESWFMRNKELIMMSIVFVFFIVMTYVVSNAMTGSSSSVVTAIDNLARSIGSAPITPPG